MALFGKDEKTARPDDARPAFINSPVLPGDPAPSEQLQAHLGKGSCVEGKLTFEGSVRIDGQVNGEIQAQEAVIIGDTAVVNAQITAGTVILTGKLTGDVIARKRVELRAPGKLTGNITTPTLVIHEGVTFEGHCTMGNAGENKSEKSDRKVAQFPRPEGTAVAAGGQAINK
ncbi:MAG: polymer-forming cytoskeletal protein [Deltaproteobacteria bacterium]|nr:polymer-forming cytoskeletal protein [Deltaproteobacteria bacterium]